MATVRLIEKTKGWDELMKLGHAGRPHTKVGWLEEGKAAVKHADGKLSNAEIAAVHEYGGGNVPERKPLRGALDRNQTEIVELTKKLVRGIFFRQITTKKALQILGFTVAGMVKTEIRNGLTPKNTPATIERKLGRTQRGANAIVDFGLSGEALDESRARDEWAPRREDGSRESSETRRAFARHGRAAQKLDKLVSNDKPLVDTGQIINAITHAVIEQVPT